MKRKRLVVLLSSMALMLAACGQASYKSDSATSNEGYYSDYGVEADEAYDAGFSGSDYQDAEESAMDSPSEESNGAVAGAESSNDSVDSDAIEYRQKLIRNYSYSFQTTNFEESIAYVEEQVNKYKGYIENSEIYGSRGKTANMTIRIPEKNANSFLQETGEIGEIVHKTESTEDITLKYYDTKSRLESLNAQHDRILDLLKKAETLEDVVSLEEHLSNIEYQIDNYGSQIKLYDNLVNYVTIEMNIDEVSQVQVVEEDGFWTKIGKRFSSNAADVIDGLLEFVIFIITGIPYFIVIGVVAFVIIAIIKKIRKKSKKKDENGTNTTNIN